MEISGRVEDAVKPHPLPGMGVTCQTIHVSSNETSKEKLTVIVVVLGFGCLGCNFLHVSEWRLFQHTGLICLSVVMIHDFQD